LVFLMGKRPKERFPAPLGGRGISYYPSRRKSFAFKKFSTLCHRIDRLVSKIERGKRSEKTQTSMVVMGGGGEGRGERQITELRWDKEGEQPLEEKQHPFQQEEKKKRRGGG